MIPAIDNFLNRITMYRLVLYSLVFLWITGFMLSMFGTLQINSLDLLISSCIIFASCILINICYQTIFKAPSNPESTYITSLILSLVAGPENSARGFILLVALCFIAISSKYLIAIQKKHIFNPAAFSMAVMAYFLSYYPSWWIGDAILYPFVIIVGVLITRKLQRFDLVISFLLVFMITSIGTISSLQDAFLSGKNLFAYSPILFFSFIMLTEPSTTPPKRSLRMLYGSLTAILIAPFFHLGSIYLAPESALILSNIFSYLISPKKKLLLVLKNKKKISLNTYEFSFSNDKKFNFKPGQYMEWTLPHKKSDDRGLRRYFTLSSSPTEDIISIGVKFYDKPSTFKEGLNNLKIGEKVIASQLAGEFILPENKDKKLVFIAGGIGVTPFRSMIKYLVDKDEKRDIVIFYAVNSYEDISFKEVFDDAEIKLGIKTVYIIRDSKNVPAGFLHKNGMLNEKMISEEVKNVKERVFYISGPRVMIVSFDKSLKNIGVKRASIKTDFFPGYT